jgi:CO dehydrogenase/acetyl-CoA synthase gamma subunit (corrinoid Fe-S protein)
LNGTAEIKQATRHVGIRDHWINVATHFGINRQKYIVDPGLYALGSPDQDSPVFVTANYSPSFRALRTALRGVDGYILVLDTKGINVWCAAGKGTFGTDELVLRIEQANLGEVVNHRRLIVPQLGAPGVAAHEVEERTGFGVAYGCRQSSSTR